MFPFTNSESNNLDPLFKRSSFQLYDQIQNPIPKHNDETHFFSNFPSPFFDEHELPLNQIFHNDDKTSDPARKESPKLKHKTNDQPATAPPRRRNPAAAPRKRTGKKDRHSKICTAQGVRDRRMRLSLQVARKFFDLQDMLGYDKASKTIEWLFSKSKKAIKELVKEMSDAKSESLISECEVVSGIEESSNIEKEGIGLVVSEKCEHKKEACKKESREKARARARCRTEEKMMGKRIQEFCKTSPNAAQELGLLSSSSLQFNCDNQAQYGADDYSIEKLLGNCGSVDPSFWEGLMSNERLNYAVTNVQALMAVYDHKVNKWRRLWERACSICCDRLLL